MKTTRLLSVITLLVLPLGLNAKPAAEKTDKGAKMSESAQTADAETLKKQKQQQGEAKAEKALKESEKEKDKAKEKVKKAEKEGDLEGKKADQERKELGKGSEQGQAQRAEHSRKWWKFWGKDGEAEKPKK